MKDANKDLWIYFTLIAIFVAIPLTSWFMWLGEEHDDRVEAEGKRSENKPGDSASSRTDSNVVSISRD